MNIYHYDAETLDYVGESIADLSPLEPGVWLIPAHATTVTPKVKPKEGEVLVFENGVWLTKVVEEPIVEEVEDHMLPYQRSRWANYPTLGDQLDALYHAGVFPEEMTAQIKAVKDLYPKPIEGSVE
tara:strand:- start:3697 stop:4074 length:378 start_codon:yes stop_codon:yes gene_type:complete